MGFHCIDIKIYHKSNSRASEGKQMGYFSVAEFCDLDLMEHAFHLRKTKLKAEKPTNKQQLKMTAVKASESISREEVLHCKNPGFKK